ncbi:MAG: hypothetical protein ABIY70_21195 [Capsulimonas sp.]|uniref:hypothetical protein n=1 Tax=Capsulimonas sp. TaxID=2494211 RepID=UPI003266D51E
MNIFFSTGKLRLGPVGAILTDVDHLIATVQSGELSVSYQEKKLMEASSISLFAVVTSFYGGAVKFKAETNDIKPDLFTRVAGASKTTAGGRDKYTIGKLSKPLFSKLEFEGQDVDGNTGIITLYKCYALALPISLKLDDHASVSLDFDGLPGTDGIVMDTSFVTPV